MTLSPEIIAGAQNAARTWGVPACAGLAQCILESEGFTREPSGSNNGLGIQALPGLPSVAAESFEYVKGVREPVVEHFAAFASIADAFYQWGKLLATNPVYAPAFAVRDDWRQFIELMGPRYATAPNYAAVLISIVQKYNLDQYNVVKSLPSNTLATAETPLEPAAAVKPVAPATTPKPIAAATVQPPRAAPSAPPASSSETSMLSSMLALFGQAPALVGDALAAYHALQTFLASDAGQSLEANVKTLFTHTSTPGAAVVAEPKASATAAK